MWNSIEEFSKTHQYTIQAASAVGTVLAAFATVAAILTSLYLARRSESVRIKPSFSIGLTNTSPMIQYACIILTNVGMRDASVPILFFDWKIPLRRTRQPETIANWINVASSNNVQREIKPGQQLYFALGEMPVFRQKIREEYLRMFKTIKWFRVMRIKRVGARVYTQDGSEFPVVFDKIIREEISALIKKLPGKGLPK